MGKSPAAFWSVPSAEILQRLESAPMGLTDREAQRRLSLYGSSLLKPKKRSDTLTLLVSQFKSPIILILLFATGLSFFLHDHVNAIIILVIVVGSGLLGFWQERGAADAVEKLLAIVQIRVPVIRDGTEKENPTGRNCPGRRGFRTGWFMESVASASLIVLFIRSRKPFFKSKPGNYLLVATLIVFAITLFLPFSPLAGLLEFWPLPLLFLLMSGAILIGYIVSTELPKGAIYARVKL